MSSPHMTNGSVERCLKSLITERLQKVVDGMRVEGAEGVSIVRRHEDHGGKVVRLTLLDQRRHDTEPVKLRHLYVQEEYVHRLARLVCVPNDLERFRASGTTACELHTSVSGREMSKPLSPRSFVVNDHHANGVHAPVLADSTSAVDAVDDDRSGRSS
jgi:hypothetical protein